MGNRPLGITLICIFFGLIGLSSLVSGLSMFGENFDVAGEPESVHLFLTIAPYYFLILGTMGLFAATLLWGGRPVGRIVGLIWIGVWILSELLLTVWATTGPETVQQAGSGIEGFVLRFIFAVLLFYYIWIPGKLYVTNSISSSENSSL